MIMHMLYVSNSIQIHEEDLQESFIRASGPGGQNVNKVATAVQLRFDAAHCRSLSDDVRQRLARLAGRRMTVEGMLIIDARRFRTQERNRSDALDRLITLIRKAAERPKTRRKTRVSAAAKKRRVEAKRQRGGTKKLRRPVGSSDE